MSDYLITFKGYVDTHKRPEGFPHVIEDLIFIRANSHEQVVKAVNDYSEKYIRLQGMSVRKDPHIMEDAAILDTNRCWVPMHMLTHFDVTVKQITGDVPTIDDIDDGGSPAVKN